MCVTRWKNHHHHHQEEEEEEYGLALASRLRRGRGDAPQKPPQKHRAFFPEEAPHASAEGEEENGGTGWGALHSGCSEGKGRDLIGVAEPRVPGGGKGADDAARSEDDDACMLDLTCM